MGTITQLHPATAGVIPVAIRDAESIRIEPLAPGIAEVSYGTSSFRITYDALLDLTYQMARFVACHEATAEE